MDDLGPAPGGMPEGPDAMGDPGMMPPPDDGIGPDMGEPDDMGNPDMGMDMPNDNGDAEKNRIQKDVGKLTDKIRKYNKSGKYDEEFMDWIDGMIESAIDGDDEDMPDDGGMEEPEGDMPPEEPNQPKPQMESRRRNINRVVNEIVDSIINNKPREERGTKRHNKHIENDSVSVDNPFVSHR
jgi:hypothetical protein